MTDNGYPITNHIVEYGIYDPITQTNNFDKSVEVTGTSTTLTGLTPGYYYRVQVKAVNAKGVSRFRTIPSAEKLMATTLSPINPVIISKPNPNYRTFKLPVGNGDSWDAFNGYHRMLTAEFGYYPNLYYQIVLDPEFKNIKIEQYAPILKTDMSGVYFNAIACPALFGVDPTTTPSYIRAKIIDNTGESLMEYGTGAQFYNIP